jgi:GTP cyclohydrolase II
VNSTPLFRLLAEAPLPTAHGTFRSVVFAYDVEHVALIRGDVAGDGVLVRVHSECLTGEAFGSLKCDCGAQLDASLATVATAGRGVVVYLRGQEGRGIGLANKIRAYALQADGADTVDANRALGLPDDARSYDAAAAILRALGVRSVDLMTNNPAKVEALERLGVPVRGMVPLVVPPTAFSAGYLTTKRERMGHVLPDTPSRTAATDPHPILWSK